MADDDTAPRIRGSLLRCTYWVLRLVWGRYRLLFAVILFVTAIRGFLPAALALTARGLIDTASAVLQGNGEMRQLLYFWLGLGFLVALAEAISAHLNGLLVNRLRDKINTRLTVDILKKASLMPLSFFEDKDARSMIDRARSAASGKVSSFIHSLQYGITQTFQAVSLIAVLAYVEPLVLIVVGPIALPFIIYQWWLSRQKYLVNRARTLKVRRTRYFSSLLTSPRSVAEIKILGLADHFLRRFEKFSIDFKEQDWVLMKKQFSGFALFSFATVVTFYAVLVRVALRTTAGGATLGDLAIFGGAAVRLRMTLQRAISHKTAALEHMLYIVDLLEYLAAPEEKSFGARPGKPSGGKIEVCNVTFTYPGCSNPVLRDLSLKVDEGKTLALVGRNGAGKTTLVKLLTGLYEPDKGEIYIGEAEVRTLSHQEIRNSLSVVMQSAGMYEASAEENIAYGDWDNLNGKPRLIRTVAERAGVTNMVEALPRGFDTRLGRLFGEHELSGGQWQHLIVARGFARETPIIILDEPTANLDAQTELDLYRSFSELAKGRTSIIISHRFSTIGMADRIAVLDDGHIIEEGSHQELIAQGGEYNALYKLHMKWMKEGKLLQ